MVEKKSTRGVGSIILKFRLTLEHRWEGSRVEQPWFWLDGCSLSFQWGRCLWCWCLEARNHQDLSSPCFHTHYKAKIPLYAPLQTCTHWPEFTITVGSCIVNNFTQSEGLTFLHIMPDCFQMIPGVRFRRDIMCTSKTPSTYIEPWIEPWVKADRIWCSLVALWRRANMASSSRPT